MKKLFSSGVHEIMLYHDIQIGLPVLQIKENISIVLIYK